MRRLFNLTAFLPHPDEDGGHSHRAIIVSSDESGVDLI